MSSVRNFIFATFAALLCFAPVVGQSPITIGASPSRFDLEIGTRPVNEALRVFNYGSEPAQIQVSVHPWTLDDQNEVRLVPPSEQSLDQWMIISPVAFEVPAGSFQTVRFSIRPRVEPSSGEHRAMIYLLQQPVGNLPDGHSVRVIGRLGIAVYGYVGEIERVGRLNEVEVDTLGSDTIASFDISSIGSAHVRMTGRYTVWPVEQYPADLARETADQSLDAELVAPDGAVAIGWLPPRPVLPDTRRRLPLNIAQELPPGEYVLDVWGEISGEPLELGVPFSVSEPPSGEIVAN